VVAGDDDPGVIGDRAAAQIQQITLFHAVIVPRAARGIG
jgi:hypothetical protein